MRWKAIVGRNVRKWRMERGFSQEELAHRVDVSPTYLGQVERGTRNVTIEVMGRMAEALGIELVRLLDRA
ncbi:MAG TPA: helix-turn-helix transcriptional regulator [Caulobacteraceae bacterium]|jgi:transcriptional regulator with XRE-family HTH domain